MPPKRAKAPAAVKRDPITSAEVRRMLPRATLEVMDMIVDGAETNPNEEALYLATLDLQRGFDALYAQKEEFAREKSQWERDMDRRWGLLERMEEDVRRMLESAEERRRPPPRPRYDNYRADRDYHRGGDRGDRDYNYSRGGDRGYGGGGGGGDYHRGNPNPNPQQPLPHPSRRQNFSNPFPVSESAPPVREFSFDAPQNPNSPPYTPTEGRSNSPPSATSEIGSLLSSLAVPSASRPYSPTMTS